MWARIIKFFADDIVGECSCGGNLRERLAWGVVLRYCDKCRREDID